MSKRLEVVQNTVTATAYGSNWQRLLYTLQWGWLIKSMEFPVIVSSSSSGNDAYLDVTITVDSSSKTYRTYPGAGSVSNYIKPNYIWIGVTTTPLSYGSTTNPIVIDGESVTATQGDVVESFDNNHISLGRFTFNGSSWGTYSDAYDNAKICTVAPNAQLGEDYICNAAAGSRVEIRLDPHYVSYYRDTVQAGYIFGGSRATSGSRVTFIPCTFEFVYDPIFNPNSVVENYLTYGDIVAPVPTDNNTYVFTANGLVAGIPYVFTDTGLVQAATPIIFT